MQDFALIDWSIPIYIATTAILGGVHNLNINHNIITIENIYAKTKMSAKSKNQYTMIYWN